MRKLHPNIRNVQYINKTSRGTQLKIHIHDDVNDDDDVDDDDVDDDDVDAYYYDDDDDDDTIMMLMMMMMIIMIPFRVTSWISVDRLSGIML